MSWTPATLGAVLSRQERARGEIEALVTEDERLTYARLAARAQSVAAAMRALGLGKGDHVAILMGNDAHWLSLFYGAALIGAVTVPVNTRFKTAELEYCLRQADCRALFYAECFLNIDYGAMVCGLGELPMLEHRVAVGRGWPENVPDQEHFAPAGGGPAPDDLLLIQFTSGTTAYPKGVMLSHDAMLRNAHAAGTRIGVRAQDRYFNCRPFFHVGGSTLSALVALSFGCTLVTLPTFEARAALEVMERERCTLTSGNDTIFQMLMGHEDFPKRTLSLRGGWAAAGPQTVRRIIDVLGAREVCIAYGLSEAAPNVVINDWRDPEALRVAGLAKPHEGEDVRIADPASNAPLAPGSSGEIQVRGWNVMRGYYNNPEATAKAFTPDGWLRTGDLGEMTDDGRLRMVGRLKDVFRVGGENVAPAEVEEMLLAHPAVETAQAIGVPDARLGEVPCAYVTLKAGATATEAELITWARERAANFRVPRYLKIVADFESIGMTASGKVQKNKLRDHALREFGL